MYASKSLIVAYVTMLIALVGSVEVTTDMKATEPKPKVGPRLAKAANGQIFTSMLDHPSTAHFFEGKSEEEVQDMMHSAMYAHITGHTHAKTAVRAYDDVSLLQASFVQVAQSKGLNYDTLKALHQRSGQAKHKDMEVWFRELAMHPSTHASLGIADHEEEPNELHASLLEMFARDVKRQRVRSSSPVVNPVVSPVVATEPTLLEQKAQRSTMQKDLLANFQQQRKANQQLLEKAEQAAAEHNAKILAKRKVDQQLLKQAEQKAAEHNANVLAKRKVYQQLLEQAQQQAAEQVAKVLAKRTANQQLLLTQAEQKVAMHSLRRTRAANDVTNDSDDDAVAKEDEDDEEIMSLSEISEASSVQQHLTTNVKQTARQKVGWGRRRRRRRRRWFFSPTGHRGVCAVDSNCASGNCPIALCAHARNSRAAGGTTCHYSNECQNTGSCPHGCCLNNVGEGNCAYNVGTRTIGQQCTRDFECATGECEGLDISWHGGTCVASDHTVEVWEPSMQTSTVFQGRCTANDQCVTQWNVGSRVPNKLYECYVEDTTTLMEAQTNFGNRLGKCLKSQHSVGAYGACTENEECVSGDCSGRPIGGNVGTGKCTAPAHTVPAWEPDMPRSGESPYQGRCTTNDECATEWDVGTRVPYKLYECYVEDTWTLTELQTDFEAHLGKCLKPQHSVSAVHADGSYKRATSPCTEDEECMAPSECVGYIPAVQTHIGRGTCQRPDGSVPTEEECTRNAECPFPPGSPDCVGNAADFGTHNLGRCARAPNTRGGSCHCQAVPNANPPRPAGDRGIISKASCAPAEECTWTHEYESCNDDYECVSGTCDVPTAIVNLVPGQASWDLGLCAAERHSIKPWDRCLDDSACESQDGGDSGGLTDTALGCTRDVLSMQLLTGHGHNTEWGYCDQLSGSVKPRCRCSHNNECISGLCQEESLFSNVPGVDSRKACLQDGIEDGDEGCTTNDQCTSNVCEGNLMGAGRLTGGLVTARCAKGPGVCKRHTAGQCTANSCVEGEIIQAGSIYDCLLQSNSHGFYLLPPNLQPHSADQRKEWDKKKDATYGFDYTHGETVTWPRFDADSWAPSVTTRYSWTRSSGTANGGDCDHNAHCHSRCCSGNLAGVSAVVGVSGTCRSSEFCVTGLIDAAGEFISDAIAAGLELLAQGLVHILRWIMQAANTVFATVSYAIPDFTEQIAQLGAQVESYNQFCARSEFTFKITRAAADRAASGGGPNQIVQSSLENDRPATCLAAGGVLDVACTAAGTAQESDCNSATASADHGGAMCQFTEMSQINTVELVTHIDEPTTCLAAGGVEDTACTAAGTSQEATACTSATASEDNGGAACEFTAVTVIKAKGSRIASFDMTQPINFMGETVNANEILEITRSEIFELDTLCLERASTVAISIAVADKMKQLMQLKNAMSRSKTAACAKADGTPFDENTNPSEEECETREPQDDVASQLLAAFAPQYFADVVSVGLGPFGAEIHKILDFQTFEYGYAQDVGMDFNRGMLDDMSLLSSMNGVGAFEAVAATWVLGSMSLATSKHVGWKGSNAGNWKNLRDGYTGDAFGVSASVPLKPLDTGVFSIDGGIALGIQSQFACSFLDEIFPFVGSSSHEERIANCGAEPTTIGAMLEDAANNMFVWKGTKTIGLELAASYDAPMPPQPAPEVFIAKDIVVASGDDATATDQNGAAIATQQQIAERRAARKTAKQAAVRLAATKAAEEVADEAIGFDVSAGISATKIFPQAGGCFGPYPKEPGSHHTPEEMEASLLAMLGYMWLGEDERLAGSAAEPWYEKLPGLLANIGSSATQLPLRIAQTVLAVIQAEVIRKNQLPDNCGCQWCFASNLNECIPCLPTTGEGEWSPDSTHSTYVPMWMQNGALKRINGANQDVDSTSPRRNDLTNKLCRLRHWCNDFSQDGRCDGKDYSDNFAQQVLTHSGIHDTTSCTAAGGSWTAAGKCMKAPRVDDPTAPAKTEWSQHEAATTKTACEQLNAGDENNYVWAYNMKLEPLNGEDTTSSPANPRAPDTKPVNFPCGNHDHAACESDTDCMWVASYQTVTITLHAAMAIPAGAGSSVRVGNIQGVLVTALHPGVPTTTIEALFPVDKNVAFAVENDVVIDDIETNVNTNIATAVGVLAAETTAVTTIPLNNVAGFTAADAANVNVDGIIYGGACATRPQECTTQPCPLEPNQEQTNIGRLKNTIDQVASGLAPFLIPEGGVKMIEKVGLKINELQDRIDHMASEGGQTHREPGLGLGGEEAAVYTCLEDVKNWPFD